MLKENVAKTAAWYLDAADSTDLVVFPELNLTGYIPLKGYDPNRRRVLRSVAERVVADELPGLAELTRGRRALMVVGFAEPSAMRNEIHNSVALIEDGSVRAVYRKIHLPVEENHYFAPGDRVGVVDTRIGRLGLLICYDVLFPEVARLVALAGVEVLCIPANWMDLGNTRTLCSTLPVARALEEQMHVVFVNGVGELEARGRRWSLFGQSRIVNALGEVVAEAGEVEEPLDGWLSRGDLDGADMFPLLRDRRPEIYGELSLPTARFAALISPR